MLTPKQLQDIPQNIVDLSRELEIELLADIGERLRLLAPDMTSPTLNFKLMKLREMNITDKRIKEKLLKFEKIGVAEIEKLFNDALEMSIENDLVLFDKADIKPIYTPNGKAF